MRDNVTLFFGVFSVMALSNAIVPVLPAFTGSPSWTGAVYAAYFLGAFISTLPAGILSDRFGPSALMRTGLALTVAGGTVLFLSGSAPVTVAGRFAEGVGAGLFIAPAMAAVNRRDDHEKMSGYFLALLNAGLVLGLIAAGVLSTLSGLPATGILLFSALSVIPLLASLASRERPLSPAGHDLVLSWDIFLKYRWVLFSSVVLIGATGVATALFPDHSSLTADAAGFWIAGMSIATIVSVMVVSRFPFRETRMIRISSLLMAGGMLLLAWSPAGLLVLGAVAGLVMIAQMALLAGEREHQGIAMGLFSTSSYLGMALLPLLAGFVADLSGIIAAFAVTAVLSCTVAFVVGRK
ncbi:MFS transporter [Methanoregula formicica]|uniref:Arabinose efflux permease family protein n=1 Tax=Methanoregula formicica (strain DSM 22288 / NBRC 105244 / SMSP) TaxID=593750 RepID=L0HGD3_METFS|nr:MFS transporter [Methanoregula formicica]AGB02846.1 arabinose efflux permease family protein [Methanoregula formicica SMSP]